ncbi:helix-turn-helix domain-containing protein [Marinobacter subterrani]|uniref:helix-turn-helix domain-containing protein n=1 Tax=Marinobacter subterrani TaxID=1658765 RepID=UPI00235487B0|nr:helix-turn-helix transcriptional regulator [Marinobacter subterrani]
MRNRLSMMNSKKFQRKSYREAFLKQNIVSALSHQIRINRVSRGWSQKALAEKIGSKQSVISRYEDPAYGKLSVSTLIQIANALDVGLEVKFTPFSRLVGEVNNWSQEKAMIPSFSSELRMIESNAKERVTDIAKNQYVVSREKKITEKSEDYIISRGGYSSGTNYQLRN